MGCGSSTQADNSQQLKTDNPNVLLKENSGAFKTDYSLKEQVGEGTYGVVRRCKKRTTGEERVVKRIHKSSLRKEEQRIKMANDVVFLRKIDHPNVIKPYEFYQDDDYFWIVTEFVSGGDLIGRLEQKGLLTEKEASNILQQVLSVLSYCHSQKIIHRDLKPENIMLETSSKNDVGYQIKVIDWGTATQITKNCKITELIGTPYYIAPEVVERGKAYDEKCDMWSMGALMYTILSGDPPFYSEDIHHILEMVEEANWTFDGDIWDSDKGGISASAKDLISKLMVKNPSDRITAEQALQHDWFKNAPSNQVSQELQNNYIQKLHNFNAKNKLHTAALMFISQQCTQKAERDQLTQAFRSMDKNQDGTLSKQEIIAYLGETMTAEQAETECSDMIAKVDIDQNGLINYSEFLLATAEIQKGKQMQNLKEAFEYFDSDKNGYITTDELRKLGGTSQIKDSNDKNKQESNKSINSSNNIMWDDVLKQVDTDNDGKISFDEFCKMIDNMATQQ